jgi:hypothetical protein
MAPPVVAAPFGRRSVPGRRRLRGRAPALTPLALTAIDHHLDRVVTLEVLLEIARQSFVPARDDEQEAIRRAGQGRWPTFRSLSHDYVEVPHL